MCSSRLGGGGGGKSGGVGWEGQGMCVVGGGKVWGWEGEKGRARHVGAGEGGEEEGGGGVVEVGRVVGCGGWRCRQAGWERCVW